jgi:hypothetical protein
MNYSKVHVQYLDGSKPKGTKFYLNSPEILCRLIGPAYTNDDSTAIVEHFFIGPADVYVSGKKVGSFHAPGETAVFIS